MKVILRYNPCGGWYVREWPFKTADGLQFSEVRELVEAIDASCKFLGKPIPTFVVDMDCDCDRCGASAEPDSGWPRHGELPLCKRCLSAAGA